MRKAAIACYLCNKYEKATKDKLYPTEPQARGNVDQLLYVSENIVDAASSYMNISGVIFGNGVTNEAKRDDFMKKIGLIENFLGDKDYLAAHHVTLADFFVSTVLLNVESALGLPLVDFPKVLAWLDRIKALPYFSKTHDEGVAMFGQLYKGNLAKNQAKK
uniref:GST C-terminal domain-containing protein n=1 Tax=Ciona savignyi TaxID=51511 RepID=H2Z1I8_CIOSA